MTRVSRALIVAPLGALLLTACGSTPPAPRCAPAPAALAPTPAAPGAPIAVAPVSCADAGVLLARTFNAYDDAMITKHEGEIAKACAAGPWPQAVLDCLGATVAGADKCIAKLPHEQQVALASSVTAATPPQKPEADDGDDKFTLCEQAIGTPEAFGSTPDGSTEDVVFAIALRKHRLVDACHEDNWGEHAKECFQAAKDSDHVGNCMGKLPDHAQTGAVTAVVGALDLVTKTFAVRKTAAAITCPKVVAKHYADATWKDKLTKIKPAQKASAMTASRSRMTKACTADKWSPTLRACVLSGGDFPECSMLASGVDPWGYPAFGVIVPTGVPACDKYLAGLQKLAECPGAHDMKDALLSMISSAQGTISEMSDENRKVFSEACEQGTAALADEFKTFSCKP